MNSIFIANTPYHLLIACGYAYKYDRAAEKHLIFASDFADADKYFNSISTWTNCPFTTITLLPGTYRQKQNIISHVLLQRAKRTKLNEYLDVKKLTGCTAYIFNDANIEGQMTALKNKKHGGYNVYMEDGFAAYSNGKLPHLGKVYHAVAKLVYGNWYQNVEILGKSEHIDEIRVFFPKNIRPELISSKVTQLPRNILTHPDLKLIRNILNSLNADITGCQYDAIIILPHSNYARDLNYLNVRKTYHEIIRELKQLDYSIGIKYHPREVRANYLNIDFTSSIEEIPRNIPIEIQFCINDRKLPKCIIGDSSTGLFSAKTIFEDNVVILSVNRMIKPEGDNMSSIFDKVNILQPVTIEDLKNSIIY